MMRIGMSKLVWVLGLGLMGSAASAQITLTKHVGSKTLIDWTGFQASGGGSASTFVQTLKQDLKRSGWFAEAAAGRGELTLTGGCRATGGKLRADCQVIEQLTRQPRFNKGFAAAEGEARRFAHQVSDALVKALTGQPGMASARVAMVGTRSGKKEMYLADSDGGGLVQVTHDKTVSVAPKWGPNNQIVYTSFLKGYPDVYLINVLTGNRERISSFSGLNTGADISPDGRDIVLVLSKDGNPEIYTKNLGSGRLTRVTKTGDATEASPSWSPDGSKIAYVSDGSGRPQIYVVSRSSGRPKRMTMRGTENVSPDWGANGKIAFCSRMEGRYQIAVLDPASQEIKVIPTPDGADYEDPSWAPDGRHIACTRTAGYRAQVYILDTMGDPPIALTDYAGDWYSPSWSP